MYTKMYLRKYHYLLFIIISNFSIYFFFAKTYDEKCGEGWSLKQRNTMNISKDEASRPTRLQPGSDEKIDLMLARSQHGLPIFNARDLRHEFHSCDIQRDKNHNVRTTIDVNQYTSLDDE